MSVVKCEDAEDEARNVIIGFIEKDEEVKQRLENQQHRVEAGNTKILIDNITSEYHITYIVDMADDSLEVRKMSDDMLEKEQNFRTFTQARDFVLREVVHPRDRERMARELDFDVIREKLAEGPSYKIEYCILKHGATLWSEASITSIGADRIIIGMREDDLEIAKRHLENERYNDYFALAFVDLDTEMIREVLNTSRYYTGGITSEPYSRRMLDFASNLTGEAKDFFIRLSDPEYVRETLAEEDKHTFTYWSEMVGAWVDITSFVILRHDDGTPAIFTLGFSPADSLSIARQEVQARFNEDMQMISGLASGYETLYYINMDEDVFKVYSLHGQRLPEAKQLNDTGENLFARFRSLGNSDLIHPDDRQTFDSFDAEIIREKLAHTKKFTFRFRRLIDGDYHWGEMDVIKFEDADERANVVAIGFADMDAEIRSEQAMNSCFSVLGKELTPEEAIDELLSIAGNYYGAERSYVFELAENKALISNTFEWCAEGIPAMITKLQNLPAGDLAGWTEEFDRQGAFCMDTLDSEHNTQTCREILEMQGIDSLIAAPIMNGDELIGFIGVDNPTKAKKNIEILKNVATVVYSEILERRQTQVVRYEYAKIFSDTFLESYVSAYYIDLNDCSQIVFHRDEFIQSTYGHIGSYLESINKYIAECVYPEDREVMYEAVHPEYIRERLKTESSFSVYMRDISGEEMRWYRFDITRGADEDHAGLAFTDVTERLEEESRNARQLEEARNAAEAASRSKTSFLFNMSHDIRTPMNAITGFTTMAKKYADDKDRVTDYLDKIDTSGQQLLTLVNQVQEMARIESGKVELEDNPINVQDEYNAMVTVFSEQAKTNGLEFHHSLLDVRHFNIFADRARMSSITLNITGNAMKYTPRGGRIDFSLKEIPGRKPGFATFVFSVEDTGIGMSEDYLKVLFEPFSREKTSTVSRIQGTGLGMSIVKDLVDLLGGNIDVRSELGKGTRFDITVDFRIDEKRSSDARIPIIALSANAFQEDKAASLAAGMNDHVAKPINIRELVSALAGVL